MNRVALSIIGGFVGFGSGLIFLQPVSAFFSATTITWNASNCPAGIYNITSYVRGDDGVVVDSVTTQNVSLPKTSVSQQFTKLPARTWQAAAITSGEGRGFRSSTQTIQGLGGGDGDRFGRSRPAATPPIGIARSRTTPAPPPPPKEPRSTAPVSASSPVPPVPAQTVDRPSSGQAARRLLRQLNFALDPGSEARTWRRFIVEDLDGDGVADVITIETEAGGLFVLRFDGQSQ